MMLPQKAAFALFDGICMLKKILLVGALLAPVLAYAGSPSTELSVQIVPAASPTPPPSNGIACDIGPNYKGSIPAAAQAAGFTHCAANYDFTQPFFATESSWLDCAGASNPMWAQVIFANGSNPPCSDIRIMSDGGIQALDISFPTSLLGTSTTNQLATENVNNGGTNLPSGFNGFPNGSYIEMVWRVSSATQNSCPSSNTNCIFADIWSWDTSSTSSNGHIEWDFTELYGYVGTDGGCDGATNCNGIGQPGHVSGFDPTVYNTYATRVTLDGTGNVARCNYLNGNILLPCAVPGAGVSGSALNLRHFLYMTLGPQNLSGSITQNQDMYVQRTTVWECSGWQTGECNGPVLTTSP
jgi:hypothetical protein